jgi:hypothetical protein
MNAMGIQEQIGLAPPAQSQNLRLSEPPARQSERYGTPFHPEPTGVEGNHHHLVVPYDGVLELVNLALERNKNRAEKSALSTAGVKVPIPAGYEGSQDLEEFEAFVGRTLSWLEMNNMLRPGCEIEQLLLIENCLKGDAATWYYDNVRREYNRWDLPSVIKGLYDRFIPATAHHKAATQFHAMKQGSKTIQELKNALEKYARRMVAPPDAYTFRLRFLDAMHDSLRRATLHNGHTAENSDISVIYKDALKYESAFKYEQAMRGAVPIAPRPATGKMEEKRTLPSKTSQTKPTARSSLPYKPYGKPTHGGNPPRPGQPRPLNQPKPAGDKPLPNVPAKPAQPAGGSNPPKPMGGGLASLTCFKCGQTGHTHYYCPSQRRAAGVRFGEETHQTEKSILPPDNQGEDNQADREYTPASWYSDEEDPNVTGENDTSPQYDDDEDPYVFDDGMQEETPDAQDDMYLGVVMCDDYEERRESLIAQWDDDHHPTIKIASMAKINAKNNQIIEPIYDHRARPKARPRPPRGHPDNKVFTVYMNIGGVNAYCLLDSGCEGVMVSAEYARAAGLPMKALEKPVTLQLACQGSKSMVNHGVTTEIDVHGQKSKEYFDVANVDYYDAILGIPFLKRFQVTLDFAGNGKIKIGDIPYQPGSTISPAGSGRPRPPQKSQR